MQRGPTNEQIEYEELNKKLRITTAKLRVAQEGVDVSSLSQHKLDMVLRIFDEMDLIQKNTQMKTSKIQQDGNIKINGINQEANKKFSNVQKRYQDLISSLKIDQPEENIVQQIEPVIEETIDRQKTHEEKVTEITEIVLNAMRDSVSKKVDEILKAVDSQTEVTVGNNEERNVESIMPIESQT